ncbi:BTAD domain-containing putative transcriptional regulator [Nocardia neocaledoniensis]|uniref:BTAD domain-containing putative transcriptional regulator n=1 Tax=Nocardia neocaledoniensis TaxID=236511 RepID=UPI0024542608|nr:BTAD domain-containing putative transcriptional regulator [Nocardia neocaledoniensis]
MSAPHSGPDGSSPAGPATAARVVVGLLGVIAIRRDETLVALPGARARSLLAALAVRPGRARSAQALVDDVWGEQPPRAPMNALHTQVSRLRALLPDGALEIGPAGYRLTLPADSVDLTAAADLARRADEHLAAGDTAASLAAITAARALWRGEPGADLPESAPADDLRAAAGQLRRDLNRVEVATHVAHGHPAAAISLARADAAAQPLDEGAHTTLIRVLALADRTTEALEVFAAYRLRLIEELGAEPGPTLIALNATILRGDPITPPRSRRTAGAANATVPGPTTARPRSGNHPAADIARPHGIEVQIPGEPLDSEPAPVTATADYPRRPGPATPGTVSPPGPATPGTVSPPGGVSPGTVSPPGGVSPGTVSPSGGRPPGTESPGIASPDAASPSGTAPPGTASSPDTFSSPGGDEVGRSRPVTESGRLAAEGAGPADDPRHPSAPAGPRARESDGPHSAPNPVASPDVDGPGPAHALGLRAAPNELLGRADDLTAIVELTRRSRVTTVLGPGGTGKTRVANAVGEKFRGTVPVVLVELASVQPEAGGTNARVDIEAAIGHVIGLGEVMREPGGFRPGIQLDARRRLREALAARPSLLILDNCEHVIEAAAEVVADLVGACAQLTVLTTSRSPLAITAESVYPLAPLTIDTAGSPATDLFSARARAVRPDVRLDPEIVARLCRTLDGLPLAIELAAARVRTMSVAEIEARLDHRFALLRSGDRTAPQRHRTLHAVIAWSWNLLDPEQQVVLRRLSMFPAGFTLSAAEIVAAGPDVGVAIDGLVGQSLLTVLDDPDGTGIRYRMLETVREFGAEQLAAADAGSGDAETTLVRDRMARWARELALAAVRDHRTGEQVPMVLAVTAELDNLVAILRTATARADADTVYTVFPLAATLWVMRGSHLEFIGWAVRLVAIAPPAPTSGEAADLQMVAHMLTCLHLMFHHGSDMRPVAVARLRARRLLAHPGLDPGLRLLGELISARLNGFRIGRLFAEGVRSPARAARLAALIARANFWENAGNVFGSTRDSLRALDDLGTDDVWGISMVCQHLAQLCGQSARYAEAVTYYRRALAEMNRLRVYDEILESRCYLIAALVGSGQRERARAELEFVIRSDDAGLRQVDDPTIRRNHRLSTVATAVAELELVDGDIDAGLRHYRRALDLLGWPDFELVPGPGAMMISAAAVSAHVLHGRAAEAADLVGQIVETTERRLSQYLDLPQIGAVGAAVGSYLLATDPGRPEGAELLALAVSSVARQDYPSMELARHVALHRDVTEVPPPAARTRRLDASTRIVELINGLR